MNLKNLYLFHGEDSYSAQQKAGFWKQEFLKKYGDYNLEVLEGDGLTFSTIWQAASSAPFLGDKKFVLVRNFLRDGEDEEQKSLAEKLESIPDFTVLVMLEEGKADSRKTLFKRLKEHAQMTDFQVPVGMKLYEWVEQTAKKYGGQIGRKDAELLTQTVGLDLWALDSEIEKLVTYCDGGQRPITAEDIERLITPHISTTVFKLTDALGLKKAQASLQQFEILVESGEDLVRVLFMLVRHFRILMQVRLGLDQGMNKAKLQEQLGLHPFVITTSMGQAKLFEPKVLQQILHAMLEIDTAIKSGKIRISTQDNKELRLALERFMVQMCQ